MADVSAALGLTPSQQVDIGLSCDGVAATLINPFNPGSTCNVGKSSRLTLPQSGAENDDHNPDRVKPRNVFNLSVGTDNFLHSEGRQRFTASIQVENITNVVGFYNFLSTFSGTHYLQPRTLIAKVGFTF